MPYVKPRIARQELGVTDQTLRSWAEEGKIKCFTSKGGMRLYDISNITKEDLKEKQNYIYCRVSTNKQKEDLERQVKYLSEKYPNHKVVKEIASGINFKRKALQRILDECTHGNVKEIVVAHRDRLCRFAWDHFEWLFHRYGTTIVVDGEENIEQTKEQELAEDLISIVHVFSSRHYGARKQYTKEKLSKTENKEHEPDREYVCSEDEKE